MQEQLMVHLNGLIVEILFSLIGTYGAWFFRNIFTTRESQEHLHKALATGVNYASAYLLEWAKTQSFKSMDQKVLDDAASKVVEYVKSSVPDAIHRLKASDDHLSLMAKAYVNAAAKDMLLKTRN